FDLLPRRLRDPRQLRDPPPRRPRFPWLHQAASRERRHAVRPGQAEGNGRHDHRRLRRSLVARSRRCVKSSALGNLPRTCGNSSVTPQRLRGVRWNRSRQRGNRRYLTEDGMRVHCIIIVAALALASVSPVEAADLLVTQYKNDPSGAPYGIALEK